ncbi:hypothetical protein ACOQFO_03730 [Ureibacillus sp. MALMAid1270]|uniref:hypothetical protein n=1 Tax=Ureibacillus sp. MALMAid1270 TaxID=3411629 RepID=UPI003BA6E72C
MAIEFHREYDVSIFTKIERIFLNSKNSKVQILSDSRRQFKNNTLSYDIVLNDDYLRIELNDLEVSYRRSIRIIKDEIGKIIEEVNKELRPDSTEYYLNIRFKEGNPFYGFI